MTYCKIFCINDDTILDELQRTFFNEKKKRIITDNVKTRDILQKNKISSDSFDEIFPIYSDLNFQMYSKAKERIVKIQERFDKIKLENHSASIGLIHYAKNDILFIEKVRYILDNKQDTIFVFENINRKYCTVKNIADELGYNSSIYLQEDHKLTELDDYYNVNHIEKSNQLLKYKKVFSSYSKNILSSNSNKITLYGKLAKKIIPIFLQIVSSKFSTSKTIESILKNIDKKMDKFHASQYGFFLSSDRLDLLVPYLQVCEKFDNNDFVIITIDPITLSFLENRRFPIIDLSQEIFVLNNLLKKTPQAKNLEEELIKDSKDIGFSLLFLNGFNLELLDGIYRSIATSIVLEKVLDKIKITNSIFNDGTMMGLVLASLTAKKNIQTTSIETLIVDENAISSILYKANKICIYGKQGLEVLQKFGLSDEQIIITGNPRYDYIASIDSEKSKAILKDKHKIDISKKIITVAPSRWHKSDEKWMVNLIKFCNVNNLEIVIKLHPRYKTNSQESDSKISYIKNKCSENKFHISFDIDLSILLAASDLVISDYSNVAVEAVLLGKTVININFINEDLTKAQNYHNFDAVLYTEDYNELEKLINEIITNNKYKDILRNGRDIMIERYNFKNDGCASERIFKHLTSK